MQSTVQRTKNKTATGPLLGVLEALEQDLESLQASLAAYESSDHEMRYEALRWHLPRLDDRRRELAAAASSAVSNSTSPYPRDRP